MENLGITDRETVGGGCGWPGYTRKERTERKMTSVEVTVNLADLAEVKGRIEALLVMIGLQAEKYPRHLIGQFVGECVDLKQFNLLTACKKSGVSFLDGVLGERFGELAGLFAEKEIQDQLADNPQLATWKDGDPIITGTVEIVDKVPDVPEEVYLPEMVAGKSETYPDDTYTSVDGSRGTLKKAETVTTEKTGRKNGPGVKTAEKIRKATNAPVKKTAAKAPAKKAGATRKTSGAADGK